MPVEIMTPQEIISVIQSRTPSIAPRCGGKRMVLSIVNQLGHLIKLEEEYKKLEEDYKKLEEDYNAKIDRNQSDM